MPETFYLDALSTNLTATQATMNGSDTSALTGVPCEYNVSLNLIEHIFQFHTDDTDIHDVENSDLLYKIAYDSATNSVFGMNLGSGETDAGGGNVGVSTGGSGYPGNQNGSMDGGNRPLAFDYVQYLAYNMFNTIQGTDLFNNEQTVRDSLQSSFITAFQNKMTELGVLTKENGDIGTATEDGTFTATSGSISNFPSKVMLKQIIDNDPSRLNDIPSLSVSVPENTLPLYKVPLNAGDILVFTLVVTSGNTMLGSGAAISNRTYLISMTIV